MKLLIAAPVIVNYKDAYYFAADSQISKNGIVKITAPTAKLMRKFLANYY